MQPVRIGMNAAVVLLVLLLSVPLQLFLSHFTSSLSPAAAEEGDARSGNIRTEAVEQLVDAAESIFDSLHSTIMYYSTWNHLKELVLVPYRKTPRTNLKSTVFKSKAGTTTILISGMDDSKTKKKSNSATASPSSSTKPSHTSSTTGQTGTKTGGSGVAKEAVVKKQFHGASSGSQKTASSSPGGAESTKREPVVVEEVSRAKEVEEYLLNEVYFGQSKAPRDRRPSSVAYSVGQVVQHKMAKYVGVIIGWDQVAKASEKWIKHYYSERKGVELTTHYLILVDSKYTASGTPYHYVPQEDLEPAPPQQLRCPEVSEYFEGFVNGRHIPKPWLRNRYPRD